MSEEIIEINTSILPLIIFTWIALSWAFGYFVAKSLSAKRSELDRLFDNKIFIYAFYPFLFLLAFLINMSDIISGVKWIFALGLVFVICFSLGYGIKRRKKL